MNQKLILLEDEISNLKERIANIEAKLAKDALVQEHQETFEKKYSGLFAYLPDKTKKKIRRATIRRELRRILRKEVKTLEELTKC